MPVTREMVPWPDVKVLNKEMVLDDHGLAQIVRIGVSRIPVYDGRRNNIVGLCLARDLIVVDPDDHLKLENFAYRLPVIFPPELDMVTAINIFQERNTHFALITKEYELVRQCFDADEPIPDRVKFLGCITLEV